MNLDNIIELNGPKPLNPSNSPYFTYLTITETIKVPPDLPRIGEIVSGLVDYETIKVNYIDTIQGRSLEGFYLSGKKLGVEFKFKSKFLYISEGRGQGFHSFMAQFYRKVYVVIPPYIEGTEVSVLLRYNYFKTNASLQGIQLKALSSNTLFLTFYLRVEICLVPTFNLCYSLTTFAGYSALYFFFKDGTNNTLKHKAIGKLSNPIWSPSGQEVIFVVQEGSAVGISLYSLKTSHTSTLISLEGNYGLQGLAWSPCGKAIVFALQNRIYRIELATRNLDVLYEADTFTNIENLQYSPDKRLIAFVKDTRGVKNLYFLDYTTLEVASLTSCGFTETFIWSLANQAILFLRATSFSDPQLIKVTTDGPESIEVIASLPTIGKIKKVVQSPCGQFLALISRNCITEDIYLYNLHTNQTLNLTNLPPNSLVADLTWNTDSSSLYYGIKDSHGYHLYSHGFPLMAKEHLLYIQGRGLELAYRPKLR